MIVPAAVRCWAEIDLSAIRYNVGVVRDKIGEGPGILAVVKANAYGHGSARSLPPSPISLTSLEWPTLKRRSHLPRLRRDVLLLSPSAPGERAEVVARRYIATVSSAAEAAQLRRRQGQL